MIPDDRDLADTLLAIVLTPLVANVRCANCGHSASDHPLGRCSAPGCGCQSFFDSFSARVAPRQPEKPEERSVSQSPDRGIVRARSPRSSSEVA